MRTIIKACGAKLLAACRERQLGLFEKVAKGSRDKPLAARVKRLREADKAIEDTPASDPEAIVVPEVKRGSR